MNNLHDDDNVNNAIVINGIVVQQYDHMWLVEMIFDNRDIEFWSIVQYMACDQNDVYTVRILGNSRLACNNISTVREEFGGWIYRKIHR